jgi:hypothetical protein
MPYETGADQLQQRSRHEKGAYMGMSIGQESHSAAALAAAGAGAVQNVLNRHVCIVLPLTLASDADTV